MVSLAPIACDPRLSSPIQGEELGSANALLPLQGGGREGVKVDLEHEGRAWLRDALDPARLMCAEAACELGAAPGKRLPQAALQTLLEGEGGLNQLAQALLPGAVPVRVVVFNKSKAGNWTLPWHQDRVVALRARIETADFSNWSRKHGVWHAEPPVELLERMIFARVHLDAATPENGCLQLALGTHARGRISAANAEAVAGAAPIEDCVADRGDVLFVSALTLHRSSASRTNAQRRAIRVDYCAEDLPAPLAWAA